MERPRLLFWVGYVVTLRLCIKAVVGRQIREALLEEDTPVSKHKVSETGGYLALYPVRDILIIATLNDK